MRGVEVRRVQRTVFRVAVCNHSPTRAQGQGLLGMLAAKGAHSYPIFQTIIANCLHRPRSRTRTADVER